MITRFVLAAFLAVTFTSPALAQAMPFGIGAPVGSAGAAGDSRHETLTTNTWADYGAQPVENHPVSQERKNYRTGKQSQGFGGSYAGGALLDSANSSAPFLNSYKAPGNFALRQQNKSSLPPTVLDSFVLESDLDPHIYGDEGYMGPPPYEGFPENFRIEWGIQKHGPTNVDLTTGHRDYNLPDAWGYPQ